MQILNLSPKLIHSQAVKNANFPQENQEFLPKKRHFLKTYPQIHPSYPQEYS
jgi:hypothetical protein